MKPIKRVGNGSPAKPGNKNKKVAWETLEIIKNKSYTSLCGNQVDISEALDSSVNGTKLYNDHLFYGIDNCLFPTLEVTNETTAQAAVRLLAAGKDNLVALNFASARNPGGGFLHGAQAQEEDLARCSGLYECLRNKPMYYNQNILCEDTYYTDGIIYSPQVPFFRDEHLLLLEKPFFLSIISAPAPNISAMKEINEDRLFKTIYERSKKILNIAKENGHKNIILGAWGCGAFGNSPEMVSEIFAKALQEICSFEHVCFPVYDTRPETPIYKVFKQNIK
jgi:uncharacterized protein (TIGR02452 family)